MSEIPPFSGFPRQALTFLRQLAKNNHKSWFHDHRADFDQYLMEPARSFVVDLGLKLRKLAPGLVAEPKVNRSLFRISRDTRFSKDKTPYKSHLGIWLWEGEGARMDCSGFYVHLEPPALMLGVGMHCMPASLLPAFRDAVVDAKSGPALIRAIGQVQNKGPYLMYGEHYKRVPRGFDPQHKRAEYLRYNGLAFSHSQKMPPEVHSEALLDYCLEHFGNMAPLHRWLLKLTQNAH